MGYTDYCIECDTLHTVCEGCGRCQHCGCECLQVDDEAVKARKRNTSLRDLEFATLFNGRFGSAC